MDFPKPLHQMRNALFLQTTFYSRVKTHTFFITSHVCSQNTSSKLLITLLFLKRLKTHTCSGVALVFREYIQTHIKNQINTSSGRINNNIRQNNYHSVINYVQQDQAFEKYFLSTHICVCIPHN